MTLYEINEQMLSLIDPDTGELLDYEAFENLALARDEKLENIGCWIKDLRAEAQAIKAEKDALAQRQRAAENKADRLTAYLQMMLNGEKFKTSKVAVAYRKTQAVVLQDEKLFVDWAVSNGDEFLRYKEPEVNKTAIKDAIKEGREVPFASIEERMSMSVK